MPEIKVVELKVSNVVSNFIVFNYSSSIPCSHLLPFDSDKK